MIVKSNSHNGIGKVNEDYLICRELPDNCVVAILTDGMGGLSHGDLAARIVAEIAVRVIDEQIGAVTPEDLLRDAINQANEAI